MITVHPLILPSSKRLLGSAAASTLPEVIISKRTGIFLISSLVKSPSPMPWISRSLSITYSGTVFEPTPMEAPRS